jgi:hypothetical protein
MRELLHTNKGICGGLRKLAPAYPSASNYVNLFGGVSSSEMRNANEQADVHVDTPSPSGAAQDPLKCPYQVISAT